MKKRTLSLLLALVMVIGLIPVTARAGELDNGLQYEVFTDHVEITGYTGNATELVIPAEIEGVPVVAIGDRAFDSCSSLTNIEIPATVTTIGENAFASCSNLTSIEIPAGVTFIGVGAFSNCESLTGIHVDENNQNYSSDAQGVLFDKGKTILTQAPGAIGGSYQIPAGVTYIRSSAFEGCSSLASIEIPTGVTFIGEHAFEDCSSLTSIEIPAGVTYICDYAFRDCSSLTNIEIPAGVISIGVGAFYDCSSLTSIEIPDSVTAIGYYAFVRCSSLSRIQFSGNAPEFVSGEWSNIFYNVTATAYYPAGNPTWTSDVMQNYGGTITWVPYTPNPFTDVPAGSFYENPVAWAVENGITTGATADSFAPNNSCLRAHVVTFLHRAAENPEPTSANNPFSDVKTADFFYKPVLWAVEKGITNGTGADKFGSYDTCNRAAVVTFLWRAKGQPEPTSTESPFVDVKPGDFYYKAVLWAVENGITNGVDATHFGPTSACNRAQVVTFLYRAYN